MFRAMPTRILLGALVSAVVAVILVIMSAWVAVETYLSAADGIALPAESVQACHADPAGWSEHTLGAVFAYGYDRQGTSLNPQAFPLPEGAAAVALAKGTWTGDQGDARLTVRRTGDGGPCALIALSFHPPMEGVVAPAMLTLLAGIAITGIVVLVLQLVFTVRPLTRRIARLRVSAADVGTDAFAPPVDRVRDDLHAIADVLERSHARIVADREALQHRNEALERHLAEIAHDLRTPLASLQLAVGEAAASSPGGVGTPMDRAVSDVAYVSQLVDNLHQATRLRLGLSPAESDCDLHDIVERLGSRFAALGRQRDVSVDVSVPDDPVKARGLPDLAERALSNLVHNAVLHAPSGGHVAVLLDADDTTFELTVADDGPGVPEAQLASLQRATFLEGNVRPRGTGLGLVITNEVARRSGWVVEFALQEPTGLRVTVRGERRP